MGKLLFFLLFVPAITKAQEKYNWLDIEDVKFYDLSKFGCEVDSVTNDSKVVICKIPQWKNILVNVYEPQIDVAEEKTCYILLLKFKNSDPIPFKLYPKQEALFDMRKNHFKFFFVKNNDSLKFHQFLNDSIDCLKSPNCKIIK
jgi:hypothetical protein